MISIKKAKKESQSRDNKRARLVLTIGSKSLHITREEARKMQRDLQLALKS